MRRQNVNRALLALLVLGGAGAIWWALRPQPIDVDVATVAAGPFEVLVEEDGVTRIRDVYTVSAPVAGALQRPPRRVGDEVRANETILAVIEPSAPGFLDLRTERVSEAALEAARAGVRLAEAQLRQAEAERAFAEADLARAFELSRREAISSRALDQARLAAQTAATSVASAEATLEVRRRELASAEATLIQPGAVAQTGASCCINVLSPVDGRVLRVHVDSEQVVQAGTSLIEVGDPRDLEVVVDLLSRDAVRITPGAEARIEGWGGETALAARVARVEPTAITRVSALGIEEQRVRAVLAFEGDLADGGRLGHNFRVVVRIVAWRADDVVAAPVGALFRQGDEWAVFVVEEGRAALRPIRIGERNNRYVRVVGGLSAGERIVLHPGDAIIDGAAVAEREGAL
ncbi:MAG: HlyD family efflux transporter periplasmic adaptor subunit [Salinarimonadaceae bacterium]|nr:MAG: HlyD family efflux transporter periplasmic adaptor subunit [Salinarimonadaceae bacterium]